MTDSAVPIEMLVLGKQEWRLLNRAILPSEVRYPYEVKKVHAACCRVNKYLYRYEQTRPVRRSDVDLSL